MSNSKDIFSLRSVLANTLVAKIWQDVVLLSYVHLLHNDNGGHERIFTSDHRPDGTTDLVEIFDKKAWLKRGSNWGRLSGSLVP